MGSMGGGDGELHPERVRAGLRGRLMPGQCTLCLPIRRRACVPAGVRVRVVLRACVCLRVVRVRLRGCAASVLVRVWVRVLCVSVSPLSLRRGPRVGSVVQKKKKKKVVVTARKHQPSYRYARP